MSDTEALTAVVSTANVLLSMIGFKAKMWNPAKVDPESDIENYARDSIP